MAVIKLSKTVGLLGSIDEWCWDEKEKFVPNPMSKEKNPFNKMGTKVGKPKEKYRDKPHISHDNLQKTILEVVDKINEIIGEIDSIPPQLTALQLQVQTDLDVITTTLEGHSSLMGSGPSSPAGHTTTAAAGTGGTGTGSGSRGGPIRSMNVGGRTVPKSKRSKKVGPSRTRPVPKNTRMLRRGGNTQVIKIGDVVRDMNST